MKSGRGCFFCGCRRALAGELRIKSGSLRQRRRENGLHAVNDIHHEQHRDVMRLFCHVVILQFFHRIGTGCTENGTGHLQVLFSDSHVICRAGQDAVFIPEVKCSA